VLALDGFIGTINDVLLTWPSMTKFYKNKTIKERDEAIPLKPSKKSANRREKNGEKVSLSLRFGLTL